MPFKVPHLPPARVRKEPQENSTSTQTTGLYVPPEVQVALALAIVMRDMERSESPETDEETEETSSTGSQEWSENTCTPSSEVSSSSVGLYNPASDTMPPPGFHVSQPPPGFFANQPPPGFPTGQPPPGFLPNHTVEEQEGEHGDLSGDVAAVLQRLAQIKTEPKDNSPMSSFLQSISAMEYAREVIEQPDASIEDTKPDVPSFDQQNAILKSPVSERSRAPIDETKRSPLWTPPKFLSPKPESLTPNSDLCTPLGSEPDSIPSTRSPASSRSGRSRSCFPKSPAATRRSPRDHKSTIEHDVDFVNHVSPPSPKRANKGGEKEIKKVAASPIARSRTVPAKLIGAKKGVTKRAFDPKRAASEQFWVGLIELQVDWMKKMVGGVYSLPHIIGFSMDSWSLLQKVFSNLNSIRPEATHRLISSFLANSIKIYELLVIRGYDEVFDLLLDFLRGVLRKYLSFPLKMREFDTRWIQARDAVRMCLSHLTQKEVLLSALVTLTDVQHRFAATWTTTEDPPAEMDMDFVCYGIDQLAGFVTMINSRIQQARRLDVYGLGF